MIGAGRTRLPEWTTLDADPTSGADIVATVPPLPDAVKARQWQVVEMIHFLEHLYLWDARHLLREIRGVLAPGGKLVIEVPNIQFAARVLCGLEKPPRGAAGQFDMWPFYGDPSHRNPLFGHRWGYTPLTLIEELVAIGFQRDAISVTRARHHFPGRDFRIVVECQDGDQSSEINDCEADEFREDYCGWDFC